MTRIVAPGAVGWIARTLEDAGHETWAVGGAVRDILAGRAAGDWDLATRARPVDVRRIFRRTVPIGIEHGTVGVLARDGTMYEVTTFRRDVETTGRHAVVEFADRLEDDLARRDFTINAIAWHPLRDDLADPFGGAADLAGGVLRTVGDPGERFAEDWLRILRALRFAAAYDLEVEAGTWDALAGAVDMLPGLSPERIREELTKVLARDPAPSRALTLYRDSGALASVHPELADLPDDRWRVALATADVLPASRPLLRLAALLLDAGDAAALAFMTRLRHSNADTDRVVGLVRLGVELSGEESDGERVRRWLSRVGGERMADVLRLAGARARAAGPGGPGPDRVAERARALRRVLRTGPALTVGDLAIDGRDLIALGLRPGPAFGEILEGLLNRVLADPSLNDPETLRALVGEVDRGSGGTTDVDA